MTEIKELQPCSLSYEEISKLAEDVAVVLNFKAGDPIESIVERLGGTIEYYPLEVRNPVTIKVENNSKFILKLPQIIFLLHKRLSIAHEIGHFILHSQLGKYQIEAYRIAKSIDDEVEYEANLFARHFLVTDDELLEFIKHAGKKSFDVAVHFYVPQPIAKVRLSEISVC
jgi:hypothetical protein